MSRIPSILALAVVAALAFPVTVGAADHNHDHGHGHDHGPATPVGSLTFGSQQIAVAAPGAAVAGKEWHVALVVTPAQPAPTAIRAWVGSENGRGSAKAKANPEKDHPGHYEAAIEVPSPLPADARLWISLDLADGAATKASLALPAAVAPTPKAGHGHGHKH